MPEAEYALYTFAYSLVAIFSSIIAQSFNTIYIVGFERLGLKEDRHPFLGVQLFSIFILVLITTPLRGLIERVYWYVVLLVFATCLLEFAKTFFRQELKFVRFSLVELIHVLFYVSAVFFLIYTYRSDIKAPPLLFIKAATMIVVFLPIFQKHLELKKLFDFGKAIHLTSTTLKGVYKFLFGYFIILTIFAQVGIFMLKLLADDLQLATYGSSFRYYTLIALALGAVHTVLLPVIQKAKTAAELNNIFDKQKKLLFLFIPVVLLGAWASQWIIPWIDKGKYPGAIIVFQLLTISSIISFAFSPHANLLFRFEDFKFLFILVNIALVINVTLNSLLIPVIGAKGAAISTLLGYGIINGSIRLRAGILRESFSAASELPS